MQDLSREGSGPDGDLTAEPGLFLFDIDGTILRAGTQVHREAFAHAFRAVYDRPLDLEGISAAGRTDTWLLAEPLRRAGVGDEAIWARMLEAFEIMERYTDRHLEDLRDRVLPGVPEVLAGLHARGQRLGLLTGNLSGIAAAKMRHAGLDHYFDTGGFGEESEVRGHLVPVALAKAGEQAGGRIAADRAVVIGDTPLDIEAGRINGTRTAGVATGPYSVEDLERAGADLVLPSFEPPEDSVEQLMALVAATRR